MMLLNELKKIYRKNNRKLNRELRIKNEHDIVDFCGDSEENATKLALIFVNLLGKKLPEPAHNMIILSRKNKWTAEYAEYAKEIKPFVFFNPNPNRFKNLALGDEGRLHKYS